MSRTAEWYLRQVADFNKQNDEVFPGMLKKAKDCLNKSLQEAWDAGEDCDIGDDKKWEYILADYRSICKGDQQALDWYHMPPVKYKAKYCPKLPSNS